MGPLPPSTPIIAISLKMYFSPSRTLSYLDSLSDIVNDTIQFIFVPDFLTLSSCAKDHPGSNILYGAQDGHWEDEGAWTGEVSMKSLKEIGCSVVELGHAERKAHFGETSEVITKKCAAAVRNGLIPLVCIGEPEEVGLEEAMEVIRAQLKEVFAAVRPEDDVILAYEPVWAIGKPIPAPTSHIVQIGSAIKKLLQEGGRTGHARVLYGGSAGPGLWSEIHSAVDGVFLGRFAHNIENVREIMREYAAVGPTDNE